MRSCAGGSTCAIVLCKAENALPAAGDLDSFCGLTASSVSVATVLLTSCLELPRAGAEGRRTLTSRISISEEFDVLGALAAGVEEATARGVEDTLADGVGVGTTDAAGSALVDDVEEAIACAVEDALAGGV